MKYGRWCVAAAAALLALLAVVRGSDAARAERDADADGDAGVAAPIEGPATLFFAALHHSSHWRPLHLLATELSARGHRIVFCTQRKSMAAAKNLTLIALSGAERAVERERWEFWEIPDFPGDWDQGEALARLSESTDPWADTQQIFAIMTSEWRTAAYASYPRLTHNASDPNAPPRIDVVVLDAASQGVMIAAEKARLPVVINLSILAMSPHFETLNMPMPAHFPPSTFGWSAADTGFLARLRNSVVGWAFRLLNRHVTIVPPLNALRREFGLTTAFDDPHNTVPLVLFDTVAGLEESVRLPPTVQLIGPLVPPLHYAVLPPDLRLFLDGTDPQVVAADPGPVRDVVYVCFGTSALLTAEQLRVVLRQLRDLILRHRVRVLWSLPMKQRHLLPEVVTGAAFGGLPPSTLRIDAFVPQVNVLAHERVRWSVSQCGVASLHEPLWYGKPLLCVPMLFDQYDNAVRVKDHGLGVVLPKAHITDRALQHALHDLIASPNSSGYTARALRMSRVMRHAGGARRGAELIEAVLAVPDLARVQEPRDTHVPFVAAANYDVALVLLSAAVALVYALWRTARAVWACLCGPKRPATPLSVAAPSPAVTPKQPQPQPQPQARASASSAPAPAKAAASHGAAQNGAAARKSTAATVAPAAAHGTASSLHQRKPKARASPKPNTSLAPRPASAKR